MAVPTPRRPRPSRGAMGMAVALTLAVSSVSPAAAQRHQDRPGAAAAETAIGQLRSPYCPGLMLEVCPSQQAALLRDSIYELAAEGKTSGELVEWMLANHGEEWRAVPRPTGVGLWAWILPPLALVIGIGILVAWLRGNAVRTAQAPTPVSPPLSDAERSELEQALRDWEASGEQVS